MIEKLELTNSVIIRLLEEIAGSVAKSVEDRNEVADQSDSSFGMAAQLSYITTIFSRVFATSVVNMAYLPSQSGRYVSKDEAMDWCMDALEIAIKQIRDEGAQGIQTLLSDKRVDEAFAVKR